MNHQSPSLDRLTPSFHQFEQDFFSSPLTRVHPSSFVGPQVTMGSGVKIGPFCVITGNVTIGSGTKIYGHSIIGFPAQDTGTHESLGSISIGKDCIIREFVSIHASKYKDGNTRIGNNCYIMNYSHIAHDVVLEDYVILINSVNIAGHAHIGHHVMLMANAAVHQFCRIGEYSCLTPYSGTRQDLPPFSMFSGQPGQFSGLNRVALKRAGFSVASMNAIKHVTYLFYQKKLPLSDIKTLAEKEHEEWGSDPASAQFIVFLETSKRGVSRKTLTYTKTSQYESEQE